MKRKNDGDWFPLSSDYPTHRKTLHLCEILANDCADCNPTRLMAWLRDQESVDGAFRSEAEVEMVARWRGERGALVAALRAVGILDGLTYHNWAEKGGRMVLNMIAERKRSDQRRNRGQYVDSTRSVLGKKEKEKEKEKDSKTERSNVSCPAVAGPRTSKRAPKSDPEGFAAFWETWPSHFRKADRASCAAAWGRIDTTQHPALMASLAAWKASQKWQDAGGDFIPAPKVWLGQERWKAAHPPRISQNSAPRTDQDEMREVLWGKEE